MSMTNSTTIEPRRVKLASREKRARQQARRALRTGDWEALPPRVPSRMFRTASYV
jgi:hypothetical protein